ncbi:MAG: hypothetical protein F6K39_22105 [Okeania sp. SIO3B3]|nr:hypothetical protein [Okeania sp. SIO3B3]
MSVINIQKENRKKCIENLHQQLMPKICEYPDGLTLERLHNQTMHENPATWDYYVNCID